MPEAAGLGWPRLRLRLRAQARGEPLASLFLCTGCPGLARGRQISPAGPQASGWRAVCVEPCQGARVRGHPEGGCIWNGCPPAMRGQWGIPAGAQVAGRPRSTAWGVPAGVWSPPDFLRRLQSGLPAPPCPLPTGPWVTHREVPKARATAGFSRQPWTSEPQAPTPHPKLRENLRWPFSPLPEEGTGTHWPGPLPLHAASSSPPAAH